MVDTVVREVIMEEVTFEQRHESSEGGDLSERRGTAARESQKQPALGRGHSGQAEEQAGVRAGWGCGIGGFTLGAREAPRGSRAVERSELTWTQATCVHRGRAEPCGGQASGSWGLVSWGQNPALPCWATPKPQFTAL